MCIRSGAGNGGDLSLNSKLAGNKIDLDYAQMKYSEYARMSEYTNKARENMDAWREEVRRLRDERAQLERQSNKQPQYTKINQAQDYFKTQGNVDIEQYRDSTTKQFDNRNTITVDYKRMPKTVQQRFNRALATKYSPYRAEALGAWGVQLKLKRK